MDPERRAERRFTVGLLWAVLAGAALLVSPFTGPILFSLFLAVALYPAYERLRAWRPKASPNLHAGLAVVALAAFFMIPMVILGWVAANEAQHVRENLGEWQKTFATFRKGQLPASLEWLRPTRAWAAKMLGQPAWQVQSWLAQYASQAAQKTVQAGGSLGMSILSGLTNVFFLFLTMFYFFRDGPEYYRKARTLIPLDKESQDKIFDRLHKGIAAIIRGWGLTVLAQGAVATLGFLIAGAEPAVLLGLAAGLAGIIPIAGTGLIWGPVALVLIAQGSVGKGVFLLCWGVGMVGLIDNLLAPYLIGDRMHMPLFLLLFGILGGTAALGITGLFVGPLLLSVAPVVFDIYRRKVLHAHA